MKHPTLRIKHHDKLQGLNVEDIEFTDCEGNEIEPIYLEKHDTITVTVCGTGKTPCPKKATYSNTNGILKFESHT